MTRSHAALTELLARRPRAPLALLPTPIHRLANFERRLGGPRLWIKRDDLTGLEGGGNKTRKLEYLVGDALATGADMLVTVGAIQSNHTRQTAAAAARHNLKCALLHFGWAQDTGPLYRRTGNILLSSLMGAELYLDDTPRPIEDQSPLVDFVEQLRRAGHSPYLIPGGASEHRLGGLGYLGCAAEILAQSEVAGVHFEHVVHCTGSSSTQAGLLAGFALTGTPVSVIGVADDHETEIKSARVLELANNTLAELGTYVRVRPQDVEIIAADLSEYGAAEPETFDLIRRFARAEGIVADPVYEGKALRGLEKLVRQGRFDPAANVLLLHLGGTPAIHAYADQFGAPVITTLPIEELCLPMTRFAIDAPTLLTVVADGIAVHPGHQLVAPNHIRSQALTLLLDAVRSEHLSEPQALERHERMTELKMRLLGDRVSRRTAWQIARQHGCLTILQAEYLAVAKLQADALITTDRELASHAAGLVVVASIDELTKVPG